MGSVSTFVIVIAIVLLIQKKYIQGLSGITALQSYSVKILLTIT